MAIFRLVCKIHDPGRWQKNWPHAPKSFVEGTSHAKFELKILKWQKVRGGPILRGGGKSMTSSGGDDVIIDDKILSAGVNSYYRHTVKISWKNIKSIKSYQKFSFFQRIRNWRWKMKKKKMKIFSTWPKYFNSYFSEALNFADFKYVFRFFISFFDQKLQPSKVGPFCLFLPVFGHF